MTIFEILESIEKTSGTNDKLAILEAHKDNELLKVFLKLGLDDRITFGVAHIKEFEPEDSIVADGELHKWFLFLCDSLIKRKLTGNSAHHEICDFLHCCTEQERLWYRRCIEKNLKSLRMGASLVNKVWPLLCLDFKCMLAEKEDKIEKIDFSKGVGVELKGNGVRTFWFIDNNGKIGNTIWYPDYFGPVGRSGMPFPQLEFLIPYVEALKLRNAVIDSEVHCNHVLEDIQTITQYEPKDIKDFTNAKGQVKKSWDKEVAKAAEVEELRKKASINIIDVLTIDEWKAQACDRIYNDRRSYITHTISKAINDAQVKDRITIMPAYLSYSYDEAIAIAKKWIAEGLEGAIIKPLEGLYRWTRHVEWCKVKEEVETDVLIVGYEIAEQTYDTTGNPNPPILGKFLVVDSEGRKFGVGTGKGWTYEFYKTALENIEDYMNKVMKITAQRFTATSAICPRFDCWRPDKLPKDIIGEA